MPINQFSMPSPQGGFFVLNSSAEISAVPARQTLTAAFCPSENLLYIVSAQNGQPTYLVFQTSPYTPPRPEETNAALQNVMTALDKINARLDKLEKPKGGSINELI